MAKLVIKLANNVAHMVNEDPRVSPWLRFAFLPDYNVSAMEVICRVRICQSRYPPPARKPRAQAI